MWKSLAFILIFIVPGIASANDFRQIVVIGDSLSDTGNRLARLGFPGPPYFNGRLTNGYNWVDVLSQQLGLPELIPSAQGGTNFAQAGALAGSETSPLPGHAAPSGSQQINELIDSGIVLNEQTLVVLWIGSNNLVKDTPDTAATIVSYLRDHVIQLYGAGARNFLVGDFAGLDTNELNSLWQQERRTLEGEFDDLEFALFSFSSLLFSMYSNPSSFGLTNLSMSSPACRDCSPNSAGGGTQIVSNPDEYLWWDITHPTRVVHNVMGQRAVTAANRLSVDIVLGDFNGDRILDITDLNILSEQILLGGDWRPDFRP